LVARDSRATLLLAAWVRPFAFPNLDLAFAPRLGDDHDLAFAPRLGGDNHDLTFPRRFHSENAADSTRYGPDGPAHYTADWPSSFVTPGGSFFSATNCSLCLGDTRAGGYDRNGKCTQYCISLHDGSIFVSDLF
jgi:hypothetical protein